MIVPEIRNRLWDYIGGTARELGMKSLVVGGIDDHAHLLLSLPSTICIAEAIQKIKANSSRWVHETFPHRELFGWQKGYGAFSIGIAQVDSTIAYIRGQETHHRRIGFRDEFVSFVERHGLVWQDDF